MKKIAILSVFILLAASQLIAQQDNTIYFDNQLPQSILLNPAQQNNCKIYFGGLIVPFAGQVLPPMHFNYSNNNLMYKNVIHPGTGIMADSLIIDIPKMLEKIKKVEYIALEADINWFSAGYHFKDFYFSFNMTDRVDAKISIPHDLIQLAWEGNGKSFIDNEIDFRGLGISATWYREFAVGVSKKINDKLTLGIRPKLLFGKVNLWTHRADFRWNTSSADYTYDFHTNMEVNITQPYYSVNRLDYDYKGDSLIFEYDTLPQFGADEVKQMIFDPRNPGMGLDLGAIYELNNKITLYSSVVDLGFISWKNNPITLKVDGDFTYDGWDVQPYLQENDSINQAHLDNFQDSVIHIFEPEEQSSKYYSYLTPKIYLGGTYQWKDNINFGFLSRIEIYQYLIHPSFTVSANAQLKKWFGGTISYSFINRSAANVGLALIFKMGPVQTFMATDNFLGFIWPQSTKNINFRFGTNILLKCKKCEAETLIK